MWSIGLSGEEARGEGREVLRGSSIGSGSVDNPAWPSLERNHVAARVVAENEAALHRRQQLSGAEIPASTWAEQDPGDKRPARKAMPER